MFGRRYVVKSVADAYVQVGSDLLNRGKLSSPRGLNTLELIAPQIVITDPREKLVYNEKRKFNLLHALNESILLFSTSSKVEHIAEFNKNMANFSDDGEVMYGSYGKRIAGYIDVIVEKLRKDKDTRQAVLSIYHNVDMVAKTKDVPCTSNLQFLIREDKLHMIANMRSNDILFGFQFDVVMFTNLQETVANTLGIDVGCYIHQPSSLHVYEKYPAFDGFDMLGNMVNNSKSVRFENNGHVDDWMKLAEKRTSPEKTFKYMNNGETTDEILRLLTIERIYKSNKGWLSGSIMAGVINDAYNSSPSWAKPFLQKWNKKGLK